jgi:hypothetical protein
VSSLKRLAFPQLYMLTFWSILRVPLIRSKPKLSWIFPKFYPLCSTHFEATSSYLGAIKGMKITVVSYQSSPTAQPRDQPGMLTINGFEQLSSLFSELQAEPEVASRIKGIQFMRDEEDEVEYAEGEVDDAAIERATTVIKQKRDQCNADMTYILEQITQRGQLESFKWNYAYQLDGEIQDRPEAFWTALGNASETLRYLSLELATHELHELGDIVSDTTRVRNCC